MDYETEKRVDSLINLYRQFDRQFAENNLISRESTYNNAPLWKIATSIPAYNRVVRDLEQKLYEKEHQASLFENV